MEIVKENFKYLLIVIICVITSTLTSYYSAKSFSNNLNNNEEKLGDTNNYLFNSGDVRYDNTDSGINSNNVQGAIDELNTAANNFTTYDTRLQGVETIVGNDPLTTTSQTLTEAINELKTSNGYIRSGIVLTSIGQTSSSDSNSGIIINDTNHKFTVNEGETAIVFGSCGGLVGLDWYTLLVVISVMTDAGEYHQSVNSVYTNANNTSYRAGGYSFKITTPGTYYIRGQIIPQSGAVVSIGQYNAFIIHGAYLIFPSEAN